MTKKILLVICDGLGDRPVPELGGKTPLQAARTPNIDGFAAKSMHGLLYTIAPGITPGSDTSHLSLLGYDPSGIYTGRGPFEAAGIGISMNPGDVAFRCNFATVDSRRIVVDRRAGRIGEPETGRLSSLLPSAVIDGANVTFRESTEHRCVVVIRGKGLGSNVTDTDPGVTGKEILKARGLDDSSARTAEILNQFTDMAIKTFSGSEVNRDRVSRGLPAANAILARGGGIFPHVENFMKKHGMTFGAVAAEGLIIGICRVLGGEVVTPPGATANMNTDLLSKGRAAVELLGRKDFVLIHVKPTDIAGHDGNSGGKIDIIQRADEMVGEIMSSFKEEFVFAITGDHSTPVTAKEHTCDPVPLLIYSRHLRGDGIAHFDEISAGRGSLSSMRGLDLMTLLKGYADRNEKYGA